VKVNMGHWWDIRNTGIKMCYSDTFSTTSFTQKVEKINQHTSTDNFAPFFSSAAFRAVNICNVYGT